MSGSAWERALSHTTALSSGDPLDPGLRVTLNFHPELVLDRLVHDGVYRSQFVTGTSNGGLTAHPGGDRWRWESRLNAATLQRATFCYPDSFYEPSAYGVAARMALIELAERDEREPLDDYVEAQVHGQVLIARDVEALVLDPSHRCTPVEAAAELLGCPVEWHGGFRLAVQELRRWPDYRGQEFVDLGAEVAVDGWLDPRILGNARLSGRYDQQALKRVWHYLARFGSGVSGIGV